MVSPLSLYLQLCLQLSCLARNAVLRAIRREENISYTCSPSQHVLLPSKSGFPSSMSAFSHVCLWLFAVDEGLYRVGLFAKGAGVAELNNKSILSLKFHCWRDFCRSKSLPLLGLLTL